MHDPVLTSVLVPESTGTHLPLALGSSQFLVFDECVCVQHASY